MPPIEWKVVGVAVAGFSHEAAGTACEDSYSSTTKNGWLVAAVSDGAGTAARASEGSVSIANGIVSYIDHQLAEVGWDCVDPFDEAIVRAWVEGGIEQVRAELSAGTDGSLADFHATLLGVVARSDGGFFFHVGDGAGCATIMQDFSGAVMSLPENGEYANETFFFTQDNWNAHLRLSRFDGRYNLIALMSDGVTPFALAPGMPGPHIPFFVPLSRYLADHSCEEGQRALTATLAKDEIRRITGDDKTFVWALRVEADVR